MTDTRWKQRFTNYINSLVEFEKLVNIRTERELSIVERTALIKFFEISNQLAVDMLKDYLKEQGTLTNFPRETIRQAFKGEWIADGQMWIDILEARNKASHVYDEKIAQELYSDITNRFFPAFKELAKDFTQYYNQDD